MYSQIKQLYELSNKKERLIIGLMSGTSLDGLDIALCRISGSGVSTNVTLEFFTTSEYDASFKQDILEVFARPTVCFESLCLLNVTIAQKHAELINQAIRKWGLTNQDIDLIASHGQTVFHTPRSLHNKANKPNATLQVGDGDHIAALTSILTISDFRQKDIAHGGEGAPLAMYGDFLMFCDAKNDRVLLNIGGIANFTFLPASQNFNKVVCTDVGPGNTLMDAFTKMHFGTEYDKNAQLASRGTVISSLFDALISDSFFALSLPKTTGPEYFNLAWLDSYLMKTNNRDAAKLDILCTLNHLSAFACAQAIKDVIKNTKPAGNLQVFISGGGSHNPLLIINLERYLGFKITGTTHEAGIDPDAKEAVLFALLANETVAGDGEAFCDLTDDNPLSEASESLQRHNKMTPNRPPFSLGKISFP